MTLAALIDAGADADDVGRDARRPRRRRLRAHVRTRPALRDRRHLGERRHRRPRPRHDHSRPRPRPSRRRHDPAHVPHRPYREIRPLLDAPTCPTGCATGRAPCSPGSPRSRARSTASIPPTSSCTRSGSLDAIVDVVGVCAALESLDIDRDPCAARSPSARGTVRSRPRLICPTRHRPRSPCSRDAGAPTVGLDDDAGARHPDRRRPDDGAGRRFGAAAADDDRRRRLRRGHRRHAGARRTSCRSSSATTPTDDRRRRPGRLAGAPARGQRRRRHRRGARRHHRRRCSPPAPTTRGSRRS